MKPASNQLIAEFSYCRESVLGDPDAIARCLVDALQKSELELVELHSKAFTPHGTTIVAVISESHIVLHSYPEARHLSVDVFTCGNDLRKARCFLEEMERVFTPAGVRVAELRRGGTLDMKRPGWIHLTSTDGLDIRLQTTRTLHQECSAFQRIEVVESKQFGKLLVIDDQLQGAESDIQLYCSSLLAPLLSHASQCDDVLLLGGGDGFAAATLVEKTKLSVTVVDIDPRVAAVCKEHFQPFTDEMLAEQRCTTVHKEAIAFLREQPVRRFSAIVYDLTMAPEAATPFSRREYWEQLFPMVADALQSGGLLCMQCGSAYDKEGLALIDGLLKRYFTEVQFTEIVIPSFCRPWVFASARSR